MNYLKTNLKMTTLVRIARDIETILGVSARGTENEVKTRIAEIAGHCRTKEAAARELSEYLYNHNINGDYEAIDDAILNSRAVRG